jgi:hypothetical protein
VLLLLGHEVRSLWHGGVGVQAGLADGADEVVFGPIGLRPKTPSAI